MEIKKLNSPVPVPVAVIGKSSTNGEGIFFQSAEGKIYHFNGRHITFCDGAQWEGVSTGSSRTPLFAGDRVEIEL